VARRSRPAAGEREKCGTDTGIRRDYINSTSMHRLPTGLAQQLDDIEEQIHE